MGIVRGAGTFRDGLLCSVQPHPLPSPGPQGSLFIVNVPSDRKCDGFLQEQRCLKGTRKEAERGVSEQSHCVQTLLPSGKRAPTPTPTPPSPPIPGTGHLSPEQGPTQ